MEINERKDGEVIILEVKGDVNINAPLDEFQRIVRERLGEGARKFVVDLGGLTWIDSSGIGELIKALVHVMRQGGHLKLAKVPSKVRGLLAVTNLTQVFEIFEDEQAAARSF